MQTLITKELKDLNYKEIESRLSYINEQTRELMQRNDINEDMKEELKDTIKFQRDNLMADLVVKESQGKLSGIS